MTYPFIRKRNRGGDSGRTEIVFYEDHGYEEAQAFAMAVLAKLGVVVTSRIDGPDAWIWDAHNANGRFIVGYDDFPCETTLWAADASSDGAISELFGKLTDRPFDVA